MEVVVDGLGGWGADTAGTTVGEVLRTIRSSLGGRAIVSLVLDGEPLTEQRQSELARRRAADFGLLIVRTVDAKSFSLMALEGIVTHLRNLERAHALAAQHLEASELGRAMERLAECHNGWDTLARALRDVATVSGIDLRRVDADGKPADERFRDLQFSLARFRTAQQFRDLVREGDLAEHDLRPMLAGWRAIVDALRMSLTDRSDAS
jgi:hypothetical protein